MTSIIRDFHKMRNSRVMDVIGLVISFKNRMAMDFTHPTARYKIKHFEVLGPPYIDSQASTRHNDLGFPLSVVIGVRYVGLQDKSWD